MRKAALVAVGCCLLVLTGCGSKKPKDLIVGKWQPAGEAKGDMMTLEYTADGKVIMGGGPITMNGTYKFLDDDTLEQEFAAPGFPGAKMKLKVKINGDEMESAPEQGKGQKFTRVK